MLRSRLAWMWQAALPPTTTCEPAAVHSADGSCTVLRPTSLGYHAGIMLAAMLSWLNLCQAPRSMVVHMMASPAAQTNCMTGTAWSLMM